MPIDAKGSVVAAASAPAQQHIQTGAPPDWAISCSFDLGARSVPGAALNYLLFSRQVHAEKRQVFFHEVVRLEKADEVERLLPWQIHFRSETRKVIVHSIRRLRGDQVLERIPSERWQVKARELGEEQRILEGMHTLAVMPEEFRVGDILEVSYTIEDHSNSLPDHCASLFELPPESPVGRFHFSVRFDEARSMRWKSSAEPLPPAESHDHGLRVWTWSGENVTPAPREPYTPVWWVGHRWIQVSDVPDWETLSQKLAAALNPSSEGERLQTLAGEITGDSEDKATRVARAVEYVQDHFRCIATGEAVNEQVPGSFRSVLQQGWGTSLELAGLLKGLLEEFDCPARLVLVNTRWRKLVSELLPAPHWDHAIVEYSLEGETRWVDPTLKHQGGDALNRTVPDYGPGLPLDAKGSGLVEPPPISPEAHLWHLQEHILLDTTGAPSQLAVELLARGQYAEMLREEYANRSPDEIANERLQACAHRFKSAVRVGELQYRDDRANNEFQLAEAFEINEFLAITADPRLCRFSLPANLLVEALGPADRQSRVSPLALAYPCHLVHSIEVESPALQPLNNPPADLSTASLEFSRRLKSQFRSWRMALDLKTLQDAVPADALDQHREVIDQIRKESLWQLNVPIGHEQPPKRWDFGLLPSPTRHQPLAPPVKQRTRGADETSTDPEIEFAIAAQRRRRRSRRSRSSSEAEDAPAESAPSARRARHERRKRRKQRARLLWILVLVLTVLGLAAVGYLATMQ